MLEVVAGFIRGVFHWVESCPCHCDLISRLPDTAEGRALLKIWLKCPMRGNRAVCLARGEMNKLMERLSETATTELFTELFQRCPQERRLRKAGPQVGPKA